MKKSNKKGFTLVELVVVIAIIGILAAILVPTMMNYVKKAKLKSANSNAKLVYTTVNNQAADLMVEGTAVNTSDSQAPIFIKDLNPAGATDIQKAVYAALKDNGDNAGACSWGIDSSGNVVFAQWIGLKSSASLTDTGVVGQYPDPNTDYEKTNTAISSTKLTAAQFN